MIKRIELAGAGAGAGAAGADGGTDGRPIGWTRRVDAARDAPDDVRPLRVTWCTAVTDLGGDPRHAGVGLEWYRDDAHRARFEAWRAGAAPEPELPDGEIAPSQVVIAAEHVMRGEDWLERRWRDERTAFKHVAIARRAVGLTPAEFSETWLTGAGRVLAAGGRPALVIPDDVRGVAYVQNHPLPRTDGEWPYDAVNEVSYEDLDGLRTRVAWFAANVGAGAEPDLISANWFLATSEAVVLRAR